jgi:tetratricopeptide (TPR) repeat protein
MREPPTKEPIHPKDVIASLVRAIDGGEAAGEIITRAETLARRGGELRGFADFLVRIASQQAGKADPRTRGRLGARAGEILLRELEDEETAKDSLFRVASRLLATAAGEEPAFELLHRVFEIDPGYPPMLRAVGDYHRADGEPGEAWRFYTRYLESAPGAADTGVVELRLAQIALGYEEDDQALSYLAAAAKAALPEEELVIARMAAERLAERRPGDEIVGETIAYLVRMEKEPQSLEAELHRGATRGPGAERAACSRRLGRLREVRLDDLEGAGLAYRNALRHAPDDLEALGGVERAFHGEPATILALADAALEATADAGIQRQFHLLAARTAARAGNFTAETDHRLCAFRLAPDDAVLRRNAKTRLRKAGRSLELLEVLRAEAIWGDRVAASLEGAELIDSELHNPQAAVPWAEDALQSARELGREEDARRAEEMLARLSAPEPTPPADEAAPPEPPAAEAWDDITPPGEAEESAPAEAAEAEAPADEPAEEPPLDGDPDLQTALAAVARGRDLESRGQLYAACLAYEKALEAMPRMREPLERLAVLHEQSGRREEALSCIERLLYVVDGARERALLRARRAALSRDRLLAAENLREAITLGGDDRDILDRCVAAASAHELWDIYALATKRRLKLGPSAEG